MILSNMVDFLSDMVDLKSNLLMKMEVLKHCESFLTSQVRSSYYTLQEQFGILEISINNVNKILNNNAHVNKILKSLTKNFIPNTIIIYHNHKLHAYIT